MADSDELSHDKAHNITEKCPKKQASSCKDSEEKIIEECAVTKKENQQFIQIRMNMNKKRKNHNKKVKSGKAKGKKTTYKLREKNWKDKHCKKVLFNTSRDSIENFAKDFENYAKNTVDDVKELLPGKVWEAAIDSGGNLVKSSIKKKAIGSLSGPANVVVQPVLLVKDVWDSFGVVGDMWRAKDGINEILKKINKGRERAEEINKALSTGTDKEKTEKIDKIRKNIVTEMEDAAANNDCLKARACRLVAKEPSKANDFQQKINLSEDNIKTANKEKGPEYQSLKETVSGIDSKFKTKGGTIKPEHKGSKGTLLDTIGLGDTRGCCPGQTGHHLVQDAWLKPSKGAKNYTCDKYNYDLAPTVCVVGHDQNNGTHKKIHDSTETILRDKLKNKSGKCANGFSIECAVEVGTAAHAEVFSKSKCGKGCIKAQLEKFYKDTGCKNNILRPTDKNGNDLKDPEVPQQDSGQSGTV